MQNQKAADVKTNEAKTDYPSATAGGKGKYIFNSVILKTHLKAMMMFDQTLDFFLSIRRKIKTSGRSIQA